MGWRQRPEQILCALTWTSSYHMYGIQHFAVPMTDRRRFGWRKGKRKNNNRGGASNAGRGSPSVITDLGCLFCQRHFSQ